MKRSCIPKIYLKLQDLLTALLGISEANPTRVIIVYPYTINLTKLVYTNFPVIVFVRLNNSKTAKYDRMLY
jgi:hypothetical protein